MGHWQSLLNISGYIISFKDKCLNHQIIHNQIILKKTREHDATHSSNHLSSNKEMAAEKLLARIANVKFSRMTKVTSFHKDTSISNTFKLMLAADSNSRLCDKYRQQEQGWKYAPLDFTRTSHGQSLCLVKANSSLNHFREFHTKANIEARRGELRRRCNIVPDFDTMFYFSIIGLFLYMVSIVNLLTKN